MSSRFFLQLSLATAWSISSLFVFAEENLRIDNSETPKLSPAEEEFVELAAEFDSHTKSGFADLAKIDFDALSKEKGAEAVFDDFLKHQPGCDWIPKLLAFEKEHRGSLVGLMALRKILSHAGGFGLPGKELYDGRREALMRLSKYNKLPELAYTLRTFDGGYREPMMKECLRTIIEAEDTPPATRAEAKFRLAEWILSQRGAVKYRDKTQASIARLKDSDDPKDQQNAIVDEFNLSATPDAETYARWETEANEMLIELAESPGELYAPAVTNVDEHYYIVRATGQRGDKQATIQQRADSVLHHHVGGTPRNIVATLVDGTKWSLANQAGKVVVIQFSFTGCGPCKRMYPTLAALHEKYSDSLSLLTIMRDDDLEKTKATIAENEMDWDVCQDTEGITNAWAIQFFPTVYVIGRDGKIAFAHLADESLEPALAKMLE